MTSIGSNESLLPIVPEHFNLYSKLDELSQKLREFHEAIPGAEALLSESDSRSLSSKAIEVRSCLASIRNEGRVEEDTVSVERNVFARVFGTPSEAETSYKELKLEAQRLQRDLLRSAAKPRGMEFELKKISILGKEGTFADFKSFYRGIEKISFTLKTSRGDIAFNDMGVAKNKELVGVGATARVFIGEEFAVKVISSTRWMPKEHINTEANFLLIAQHCPYAAGALEIGHIEDLTFIVMHKARGSELFYATRHEMIWDHSSLKVSGQLTFSEKVVALLDMALGMQWLHDRGIIHRDINLSNAITDEDGHSKIIDFGFSKWIADQERGAAGTPNFASPEVYVGEVQGAESDIYSFGATIHALLTNTLILGHPNQANRDIHVDREFYKILLKSAWEKIIFPKAYQEFDQMNRGPLRSSVDNILSEMEKAFLGNLKEDFIQKIETDNKIPDFIKEDVLEILGRIWPNIIQMQECILAVQEKIASIVSGCFKREPSQRIKDDVLVKELQTLQMLVENVIKITI